MPKMPAHPVKPVLASLAALVWLVAHSSPGATANVSIVDFAFNPASVTVQVNDTVVWTWVGPTTHSTTSDNGLWNSGLLNPTTSTFSFTFKSGGSYPYFCEVHPFMTASVTVQNQTNPPPAVTNLSVKVLSPVSFDPQTGLFEQTVAVSNLSSGPVAALRLGVLGLPADIVLSNAGGTNNGVPFVEYDAPLGPGASVDFLLEYYRSNRLDFVSSNFIATAGSPAPAISPTGTLLQLDRAPFVYQGKLVIEFSATPGETYQIQYSADMQTWSTAVPPVTATGTRVQWIDAGPPMTVSAPGELGRRFYRVMQLP